MGSPNSRISFAQIRVSHALSHEVYELRVLRSVAIPAVAAFLFFAANPALAQRAPAPGMWAIGGSIGASVPTDPSLDKGFDIAGSLETYITSRASVRGQLGGSWWDIVGRGFTGTTDSDIC